MEAKQLHLDKNKRKKTRRDEKGEKKERKHRRDPMRIIDNKGENKSEKNSFRDDTEDAESTSTSSLKESRSFSLPLKEIEPEIIVCFEIMKE